MKLLDMVICLGDAHELGRNETSNAKRVFEKHFGGRKHKFLKHKFEAKGETEGGVNSRRQTSKSSFKKTKGVDAKDATKIFFCFKCGNSGHMARKCRENARGGK